MPTSIACSLNIYFRFRGILHLPPKIPHICHFPHYYAPALRWWGITRCCVIGPSVRLSRLLIIVQFARLRYVRVTFQTHSTGSSSAGYDHVNIEPVFLRSGMFALRVFKRVQLQARVSTQYTLRHVMGLMIANCAHLRRIKGALGLS